MKRRSIHRSLLLVGALACAGCQSTNSQPFRLDSMMASMRSEKPDQAVAQAPAAKQKSPSAGLQAMRAKIPFIGAGQKPGYPAHPLMADEKASTMQTMKKHASSVVQKTIGNSRSASNALDPTNLAYQAGPIRPELHLSAARVMEQQGNLHGAQQHYQQLLKLVPDNRHGLIGQARMHHRLGQMDEAIAGYQLALSRLGQDPVILNDLGLCFARSGRNDEALAVLRSAVALKPDSVMYRNNLAAALVQSNRPDQAVDTLATTHGEVLAHYNVAYLLNEKGNSDLAHFHFNEALRKNPDFDPARTMLDRLAPMVGQRPVPPKNDFSAKAIPTPVEGRGVETIAYEVPVEVDEGHAETVIPVSAIPSTELDTEAVGVLEPVALPAEDAAPGPIDVTAEGEDVGADDLGLGERSLPEIRLPEPIESSTGDPRMIAPAPDGP